VNGTVVQSGLNEGRKQSLPDAILDPSFPSRVVDREERYSLLWESPITGFPEQPNQGIEEQIALVASQMSKNLHLRVTQNSSEDDSTRETDTMSHLSWDQNEPEFLDVLVRGRKIMNQVGHRSLSYSQLLLVNSSILYDL
jgi:hypothetical protein